MRAQFTVLGEPQGKGRPKFSRDKNGGVHTRTPEKTLLYENLIRMEYQRQCPGIRFPDGAPLDMRIYAYFAIPASASKKRRTQMLEGLIRPTKKPDWDNIGKVIADSLNQIAYRDDAQIVDAMVCKFYAEQPRVEIIIQPASTEI